jgi:uncharacterized protein YoxC
MKKRNKKKLKACYQQAKALQEDLDKIFNEENDRLVKKEVINVQDYDKKYEDIESIEIALIDIDSSIKYLQRFK